MKHLFTPLLLLIGSLVFMTSCLKDDCRHVKNYIEYQPVYIDQKTFDAPAEWGSGKEMQNTGIVYSYGKYILINEFQKGIHILDNENPDDVRQIGFIDIPGNTHFTIRNQILYANKMEDLLVLDVSSLEQPVQINRIEDIFPHNKSQMTQKGIIAYYEKTEKTMTIDCNDHRYSSQIFTNNHWFYMDAAAESFVSNNLFHAKASAGSNPPPSVGIGGSMARFTTIGDQLFVLSDHQLEVVDISRAADPQSIGTVPVSFVAETLFPFQDYLFIGTSNGMHIYSVSDHLPEHISTMAHIQSCDPVITDGDYAYVTLRGGTTCGGFTNQLEAYDVKNVFSPSLIREYPMLQPHGLTKVNQDLYVCEGPYGWKKLDASEPDNVSTTYFNEKHHAFDVIYTFQNTLIFIGEDGLYQYDISPEVPVLISKVNIVNP